MENIWIWQIVVTRNELNPKSGSKKILLSLKYKYCKKRSWWSKDVDIEPPRPSTSQHLKFRVAPNALTPLHFPICGSLANVHRPPAYQNRPLKLRSKQHSPPLRCRRYTNPPAHLIQSSQITPRFSADKVRARKKKGHMDNCTMDLQDSYQRRANRTVTKYSFSRKNRLHSAASYCMDEMDTRKTWIWWSTVGFNFG